jgi:hypothetical protein
MRLLTAILSSALIGCSSTDVITNPPVESIVPDRAKTVKLQPPKVEPVHGLPVEWIILKEGTQPYFALTPEGYANLAKNVQEMFRFMEQQEAKADFWEKNVDDIISREYKRTRGVPDEPK